MSQLGSTSGGNSSNAVATSQRSGSVATRSGASKSASVGTVGSATSRSMGEEEEEFAEAQEDLEGTVETIEEELMRDDEPQMMQQTTALDVRREWWCPLQ